MQASFTFTLMKLALVGIVLYTLVSLLSGGVSDMNFLGGGIDLGGDSMNYKSGLHTAKGNFKEMGISLGK